MKVFISWSGHQASLVATALREWLPRVLAERVKPFVSSEDISKGQRGLNVIAAELEATSFGVVVITPENQNSPWINFEAGALGKSLLDGHVAPLLVGITDAEITCPLKQFQATNSVDRAAMLALAQSINSATDVPLPATTISDLFGMYWDELTTSIEAAAHVRPAAPQTPRASEDMLAEVLSTVRGLARDQYRSQNAVAIKQDDLRSQDELRQLFGLISSAFGDTPISFDVKRYARGVQLIVRPSKKSEYDHLRDEQAAILRKLARDFDTDIRVVGGSGDVTFGSDGMSIRVGHDVPRNYWSDRESGGSKEYLPTDEEPDA